MFRRRVGILGSSLSVMELTVALHYVFNTPKILWISLTRIILTGSRNRMHTIRQTNGLVGFTKNDRYRPQFDHHFSRVRFSRDVVFYQRASPKAHFTGKGVLNLGLVR